MCARQSRLSLSIQTRRGCFLKTGHRAGLRLRSNVYASRLQDVRDVTAACTDREEGNARIGLITAAAQEKGAISARVVRKQTPEVTRSITDKQEAVRCGVDTYMQVHFGDAKTSLLFNYFTMCMWVITSLLPPHVLHFFDLFSHFFF